jgi:tRNA (guanine37-N1)-methyltransferase
MFTGILQASILRRALEGDHLHLWIHNLRHFTEDIHGRLDDYPYGGGPGMVLRAEPVFNALDCLLAQREEKPTLIHFTPQGKLLTQEMAREFSQCSWMILLCGHYKDIDARILQRDAWQEISIGDFVLSGGETAAIVFVDAVTRLLPGVLGDEASASNDSFEDGLLDAPYYTRPDDVNGLTVPEVLRSGHHEKIALWRQNERENRTRERRPDLWEKYLQREKHKS